MVVLSSCARQLTTWLAKNPAHSLNDRDVVRDAAHLCVHLHRHVAEVLQQALVIGPDLGGLETLRDNGLIVSSCAICYQHLNSRPSDPAQRSA
jgi:hypothetical protein